jgi:hypothetical protein
VRTDPLSPLPFSPRSDAARNRRTPEARDSFNASPGQRSVGQRFLVCPKSVSREKRIHKVGAGYVDDPNDSPPPSELVLTSGLDDYKDSGQDADADSTYGDDPRDIEPTRRHGKLRVETDVISRSRPPGLSEDPVPRKVRWWREQVREFVKWKREKSRVSEGW